MSPRRGPPRRRIHLWSFRLAALCTGLLPFLLLEGVLALAGWGEPDLSEDPFVGFSEIRPLFELNAQGDRYAVSPSRRRFFAFDDFPASKPQRGYRIFCLGGSTVQGSPYSIPTSFTTWLELALRAADPGKDWDVVNCGGVSYASYRLVPILQECLTYQPDLFIICTGHNEFLEDRTYRSIRRIPAWLERPWYWLTQRRLVNVAQQFCTRRPPRTTLKSDADAVLDYRNGLAAFHRDPEWAESVAQHYESNLFRMVRTAKRAGVPVILIRPPSNLKDCSPFKSKHRGEMNSAEIDQFHELLEEARRACAGDLISGEEIFARALEVDPLHALTWFELGQCQLVHGNPAAARRSFVQARDLDVCPLRMTSPLEAALDRVASVEQVPLLNAHALLEAQSQHGILGGYWLVDHVHPSFAGHQQIALALLDQMASLEIVQPQVGWNEPCRQAFARHFDALPRTYFHEGQRKLKMQQLWTQGEAAGPDARTAFPHRLSPDLPE